MALNAIAERLLAVRQRIERAAERAGRDPSTVTLVAVTKRHEADAIEAAYRAGQRVFGENYVQELLRKKHTLSALGDIRWRLIGHLQRNKVKDVVGTSVCIDTLDSQRLADALERHSHERDVRTEVSIQVNVGREPQKAGCSPEACERLAAHVRQKRALELQGLMCIAPFTPEPEEARPHFRALAELARRLDLPQLSMGMSHDLEIAVEEGATMVRVGTAIFGERG